ncbi:MAG: hypothetical protein U9N35_08390 [Euryarchaeota archaeon]|nr:hypothetical protein [Euryarchaeota archaeon]
MKDVIVGDVAEILQKLHERKKEIMNEIGDTKDFYQKQEEKKTRIKKKYEKFSYVEELQSYYTNVMFCRIIYLDIKNRTTYHKKMERYCEGITDLEAETIKNIRYNDEYEEYVILAKNGERYEIYADNLRFIYPMFFTADAVDVAFDGEKVIVHTPNEDAPF